MQNTRKANDSYILNLSFEDDGEVFQEKLEIEFSFHSIIRMARVYKVLGTTQEVHKRILFLLEQVPQFLLEEVKVGEIIAVFDWFLHISFVLEIRANKIEVVTLFDEGNHHLGKSLRMFPNEKFVEFSANDIVFGVFTKFEDRITTDQSN